MGWVRDSDDVFDDEALWEADKDAALLWSTAMRECAKKDADGVLSPKQIHASLTKFRTPIKRQVVQVLVGLGLWHDAESLKKCGPCRDLSGGHLPSVDHRYIHDWPEHLLDGKGKADKLHRLLDQARRALRKTTAGQKVTADVRRRDQDECQYCGVVTRWGDVGQDRRSKDLGEIDHVNPFLPTVEALNDPSNLVVACKDCNGGRTGKGQRTPAQWAAAGGRLLRRPIDRTTDPAWVDHGSICDRATPITDRPADPDPAIGDPPRVARDSGPGTDPNRADPGSGPGDQGPTRDPGPGPHVEELTDA